MAMRGKWALVTGASSGIGADFARELAKRGVNVLLTARREARLNALAEVLRQAHRVEVRVITVDLSSEAGVDQLYQAVVDEGIKLDILVNNAGLGVWGEHVELGWERVQTMLQVDILALTQLCTVFSQGMVQRRSGWILNVASVAAFQPCPTYAAYGAAKSYVLSFSEALSYELGKSGVVVTAVCPGVTQTEFFSVAAQPPTGYQKQLMMTSEAVAAIGIKALFDGKRSVVPGWLNAALAWSTRFTPKSLLLRVVDRTMQA